MPEYWCKVLIQSACRRTCMDQWNFTLSFTYSGRLSDVSNFQRKEVSLTRMCLPLRARSWVCALAPRVLLNGLRVLSICHLVSFFLLQADIQGYYSMGRSLTRIPVSPPPPPPWWSPITSVFVVAGARSYNSIQNASSGIKARFGSKPFKTIQSASSGIRATFDKLRRQRETRNDGYEITVNEESSISSDDKSS